MEHRGLLGTVNYDDKQRKLFGKVEGVRKSLPYEAQDIDSLRSAFESQVDAYLKNHNPPATRLNGTFNVRVGEDLHRKAVVEAKQRRTTLNQLVKMAMENYLSPTTKQNNRAKTSQ